MQRLGLSTHVALRETWPRLPTLLGVSLRVVRDPLASLLCVVRCPLFGCETQSTGAVGEIAVSLRHLTDPHRPTGT